MSPGQAPAARSEASSKWIRARVGGVIVASSRRARILYVDGIPRTYALPRDDLLAETLADDEGAHHDHAIFGRIRDVDLVVEGRRLDRALRLFEGETASRIGLEGYGALDWGSIDEWYEEDEPVYVHPRDPHQRIDVRHSSRHVLVDLEGERLAETRHPTLLFETGLPVRYYFPPTDVRLDALRPSDEQTGCPYKGFASYHHVHAGGRLHENLVWSYRFPFPEMSKIQGLLAFYNERVDLTVDGERQERPPTSGA